MFKTINSPLVRMQAVVFCGMIAAFFLVAFHPGSASAAGFSINSFPTTGLAPNTVLSLSGTGQLEQPQVWLQIPNGAIEHFPLQVRGLHFSGQVALRGGKGVYRLEINNPGGFAWLNTLLYVGVPARSLPADDFAGYAKPAGMSDATYAVSLVNIVRARNGLRPLAINSSASRISQGHVEDNARTLHTFCHCYSNGGTFFAPFLRAGFAIRGEVGDENTSISEAITLLMRSPAHREQLLNSNYTTVGVGVAGNIRSGYGYHDKLLVMDLIR